LVLLGIETSRFVFCNSFLIYLYRCTKNCYEVNRNTYSRKSKVLIFNEIFYELVFVLALDVDVVVTCCCFSRADIARSNIAPI